MSRPKPWLKLWTEWIHDPKILALTLAEAGAWCKVLTLAQELQAGGHLVRGSGNPLSLEEIATCLHVNNADISVFSSMFTKMEKEGSISREDGIFTVVNFEERQSLTPSETKDAVRERVRRYREKLVAKKPIQEKVPSPAPSSSKEEKDKDKECNGKKVVTYLETPKVTANVTETPLQGKKTPDSLAATTPASSHLFEKTKRTRWGNLVQKEQFERCELEVGPALMIEAVDWALTSGIVNVKSMITVARKKSKEKGDRYGSGKSEQRSGEGRGAQTNLGDPVRGNKAGGWDFIESRTDEAAPGGKD